LKKYKIGEIAELAGVSRRTVDYYTNLGLLNPIRSGSNYRYYPEEALVRLKMIEGMKAQRLTLEEIRTRIDSPISVEEKHNMETANIDFIKENLGQLEKQLSRLQPAVAGMKPGQAADVTKQILFQSMTLVHTMIVLINEMTQTI